MKSVLPLHTGRFVAEPWQKSVHNRRTFPHGVNRRKASTDSIQCVSSGLKIPPCFGSLARPGSRFWGRGPS